MLKRVQVKNYRCLKYVDVELDNFNVLVGPNASGKSTLLDAIQFCSDFVKDGLEKAIAKRATSLQDLFFNREGDSFEILIEYEFPKIEFTHYIKDRYTSDKNAFLKLYERKNTPLSTDDEAKSKLSNADYNIIRYEISIKYNNKLNKNTINFERLLIAKPEWIKNNRHCEPPKINFSESGNVLVLFKKNDDRNFVSFSSNIGRNLSSHPKLTSDAFSTEMFLKSEFNVDEIFESVHFLFLKQLLVSDIKSLNLIGNVLKTSSQSGQGLSILPDGSNLPWVIDNLKTKHKKKFDEWLEHLQTSLPDLTDITVHENPETLSKFLQIHYNNVAVNSWLVSDGTMRLLALTLLAYIPDFRGILMIEEPENGIHPQALETIFQSLSSVYNAQVMLATHSPIIVGSAKSEQILCFSKDEDGGTKVVRGSDHPALKEWKGHIDVSTLFASGVLG
ncbi:MAG: ATP-binding protein [Candidatus Cloacimonetes bacterium]|nr:ATP-binding protein [Candidatus Cloacimonadota bacterium]